MSLSERNRNLYRVISRVQRPSWGRSGKWKPLVKLRSTKQNHLNVSESFIDRESSTYTDNLRSAHWVPRKLPLGSIHGNLLKYLKCQVDTPRCNLLAWLWGHFTADLQAKTLVNRKKTCVDVINFGRHVIVLWELSEIGELHYQCT